jgi:S1-C subfamily serine protease
MLSAEEERKIPPSVVKIVASQRLPNTTNPWKKQDPQESGGTGVVIAGRQILTNAHVVQYSSQVFVQPWHSGDQIPATVKAIAPDIDLAILTVAADGFFDKYPPLPRSDELPKIKDAVHVFGYPLGGEALSTTKGVVSRIEFTNYYYDTSGLRIQIDAAINPGNSGGPAVVGDKMVGIIFSRLENADNIGYIIPCEEIDLFLADVADGRYDGKPAMHDILQNGQNDALRRRLKLEPEMTGMVVWRPEENGPSYPLKRWDLITKIGNHTIDNSGMVTADHDLTLSYSYYIQKLTTDGKLPVELVRDGKPIRVELSLARSMHRPRIHPYLFGKYPSYMLWGPLAFSSANYEYVYNLHSDINEFWRFPGLLTNRSPLLARYETKPRFEDEQQVVLVAMLPHRLVKGYNDPSTSVVDEVNGIKIKNLRHLAEVLRDAKDPFVVISFQDYTPDALVLDRRQVEEAADEILGENGIRAPYSDDLKSVYQTRR